jgi:hypothetical protein
MSTSPDRAAYMKSKYRLTHCRRESMITVDLATCVIRVLRHRLLFTVNYWDEKDTQPCVTSLCSVAQVSSFLTSADARLLGDHAQRLHDDINTDTLFFLRRPKKSISAADVNYTFTGTKLSWSWLRSHRLSPVETPWLQRLAFPMTGVLLEARS